MEVAELSALRIIDFGENHSASLGLQRAGYSDLDCLIDFVASAFDNYHGAIVEVSDTLIVAFAGFHDSDLEGFAWQVLRS